MAKGLQIAEPPQRRSKTSVKDSETKDQKTEVPVDTGVKFTQVSEEEKVQFNKRIKRGVADGFEMLAIRTHKKVPALLEEALNLLEEKYGRV